MSSERRRVVPVLVAGALAGALRCGVRRLLARRPVAVDDRRRRRGDGGAGRRRRRAARSRPTSTRCSCRPARAATRPAAQAGDTQLLFTGDAGADYATVLEFVDTSAPGRQPAALQDERQRTRGRNRLRRRDRPSTRPSCTGFSKEHRHEVDLPERSRLARCRCLACARWAARSSSERTTVDVTGPAIVAAGPHARRRRADDHAHRHDQRRHGRELHLHQRRPQPSPPSTARASSPASRPARPRDRHRRRHEGDRRATRSSSSSPTHRADPLLRRPGRCRRTPTRTALAVQPLEPDRAASRSSARAATARRASSTTSAATAARRASSTSRRRPESVIRCADLPQPGRRRAVAGDASRRASPSTAWAARRAA